MMKHTVQLFLSLFILALSTLSLSSQSSDNNSKTSTSPTNFTDRQAIITTIKNFYIGDHTGSIKYKRLSLAEKGAYRYVNRDGEYSESVFDLDSDHADPNYKEELLSIEIYDRLALARLRLQLDTVERPEYKLMMLHKFKDGWKITSITWGFGITQ